MIKYIAPLFVSKNNLLIILLGITVTLDKLKKNVNAYILILFICCSEYFVTKIVNFAYHATYVLLFP